MMRFSVETGRDGEGRGQDCERLGWMGIDSVEMKNNQRDSS